MSRYSVITVFNQCISPLVCVMYCSTCESVLKLTQEREREIAHNQLYNLYKQIKLKLWTKLKFWLLMFSYTAARNICWEVCSIKRPKSNLTIEIRERFKQLNIGCIKQPASSFFQSKCGPREGLALWNISGNFLSGLKCNNAK